MVSFIRDKTIIKITVELQNDNVLRIILLNIYDFTKLYFQKQFKICGGILKKLESILI
jgi:hypothetical protein